MSERYLCCPHCTDAKSDHVEHGGFVEKNGHDGPCGIGRCVGNQRTPIHPGPEDTNSERENR